MGLLSKISAKDKKNILRRFLKNKESLETIHHDFREHCSYDYFLRVPSMLMNIKEYYDYVLRKLMGDDMHHFYHGRSTCIGNKVESYWKTEEDILFQYSTYNSLSVEEKKIYNRC